MTLSICVLEGRLKVERGSYNFDHSTTQMYREI